MGQNQAGRVTQAAWILGSWKLDSRSVQIPGPDFDPRCMALAQVTIAEEEVPSFPLPPDPVHWPYWIGLCVKVGHGLGLSGFAGVLPVTDPPPRCSCGWAQ